MYKSMEYVCSVYHHCVCKHGQFIRDDVFDNNEAYNHLFHV